MACLNGFFVVQIAAAKRLPACMGSNEMPKGHDKRPTHQEFNLTQKALHDGPAETRNGVRLLPVRGSEAITLDIVNRLRDEEE